MIDETARELSTRYYVAEGAIWSLSAVLIISHYLGVAPEQQIPILNISVVNSHYFATVVAMLLIAAMVYSVIEWKQSSRLARRMPWRLMRITVTEVMAIAAMCLSYSTITQGTRYSGISPAWYFGFAVIGFLLGTFVWVLAFSALMIRDSQEAQRLGFSRIPIATRANFIAWLPVIVLLFFAYYALLRFSPLVLIPVGGALVLVLFLGKILVSWASLARALDEDGKRIPFRKQTANIKDIYAAHDYSYIIRGVLDAVKGLTGFTGGSPQAIQREMQKRFSGDQLQPAINYRVRLLEELQIQFYAKDGKPENKHPSNIGVAVLTQKGRKGEIRILLDAKDSGQKKREMSISSEAVELRTEEYVRKHADQGSFSRQEMIANALNRATIDALAEEGGPNLHRLVESGREVEVVDAIKKGADVNEVAEAGWTALLYAAAQGYPKITRILLDAGANPDIGNVHGITPLMYSARYGNVEVCQILLDHQAGVDIQDIYGMTALIVATLNGQEEIVKRLLHAGADSTIATHEGKKALDIAYEAGYGKIARLLKISRKGGKI